MSTVNSPESDCLRKTKAYSPGRRSSFGVMRKMFSDVSLHVYRNGGLLNLQFLAIDGWLEIEAALLSLFQEDLA